MFADFRFALRQLAKAPGFTAVAVLALAIGIATSTTMFTFFNGLLLKPAPYLRDESTLLNIRAVDSTNPEQDMELSFPDISDIQKQAATLSGVLTVWNRTYICDVRDRPRRVLGCWITHDGFQTLGVQPLLGRTFLPHEAQHENPDVVILGYATWKEMFGGRADIIGEKITLNQATATVIGVMPQGFRFPHVADLWQPFPVGQHMEEKNRGSRSWPLYARIAPGSNIKEVQAELDTIAARLAAAHPTTNTGLGFRALTMREEATRDLALQMRLMLGAVFAILLIACGNVANLLLARSASRTREIAIRAALGAGRARLIRQVLTESLVLGLIGGVAGLLLATWEFDFVVGFLPEDMPFWIRFELDWVAFAFAFLVTLASSLFFGAFPAWQISRPDIAQELKEGGRGGVGTGRGRAVRNGLVVFQMALALVLLVVAGLSIRSFLQLQRTETGIDPRQVLTFRTGVPPTMVSDPAVTRDFFEKVAVQLKAIPGVTSAGFISDMPVSESANFNTFLPEGAPEPKTNQEWPVAVVRVATPGTFDVFRIPLLSGRLFDEHDLPDRPMVAIVDERLVRQYFPDGQALGKRITFDEAGEKRNWFTIVGVVGNVRQHPTSRYENPAIWLPLSQGKDNFLTGVIRVQGDPTRYIRAAEDAVLAVRPGIPIYYARPMTGVIRQTLWHYRFFGGLFTGFAIIALFLAAIGIYGVTAYSVSQRTQEIGVRMALGAAPAAVVRLVVQEGARLVAVGLTLGFIVAWGVARLMAGMLHGIEPHDPPTFAAVPLVLAVVALVACYVPGRRATLIDPIVALRSE